MGFTKVDVDKADKMKKLVQNFNKHITERNKQQIAENKWFVMLHL